MKTYFNLVRMVLFISMCLFTANNVFAQSNLEKIRTEADYILSCQYIVPDAAYGAINNVQGNPTWVVPRENAMAILGLILASEALSDVTYRDRAQLVADYLVRVQDQTDGGWYDQYSYANIHTYSKSPTQAAEVMIAFYKLGYDDARYDSMKKGATFLIECQKVANKTGNDDGLICGGKDASGNYYTWRWASDNAYAYQALIAAQAWASIEQDNIFAAECAQAAQRIISGINNYLYNPPVWHAVIDKDGVPLGNPDLPPQYDNLPTWISYAPQMLDLPAEGVNSPAVGEWIRSSFQQADGSCIGYVAENAILKTRKYPGLSFQASLCWLDLGQNNYVNNAIAWAENSTLYDTVNGGWIDWIEISPNPGSKAPSWQRFIDTSFYYIACLLGGYDFNTTNILNLNINWYQNQAPYYSTGAAASQMVLNYIRSGAQQPLLTQNEIYEYARQPQAFGPELKPDEIDKVLGHFDPYDYLVSNWADSYDSRIDGNPYQGYNFTVSTHNPSANPNAINNYMRDICHWMAYTVTQEDWWRTTTLVACPNTPAVVPIYGNYDNWVVIKGYAVSNNPCPYPRTDPFNTPDFTVYGFWIKDPKINGIGGDTYKTAYECRTTYFLPLNTQDQYDGLYLQVAEPPSAQSYANVAIKHPAYNFDNIKLVQTVKNNVQYISSVKYNSKDYKKIKKINWRNFVDPYLLYDKNAVEIFNNTKPGKPVLAHRPDARSLDYYLLPFGRYTRNNKFLASGVIILDADKGYFKEASWTKQPEIFLPVDKSMAIKLIQNSTMRYSIKGLKKTKAELVWQTNGYSLSPYKPYWKIIIGKNIWYVTQERKVINIK